MSTLKNSLSYGSTKNITGSDCIAVDNFLHALKHAGYNLSIDDFGTGYSSLERLKKLPVTLLKIDKSFIENLIDHSDDYFIIKSMISLAHSLKLLVLAEGIETSEQLNLLKTLNCDIAQGYFFSKPLSPADFVRFIGKKISL
ncbi:MAG: EAL domain-containing protein [Gammaproteobacteria bacterium]|nr:EAL domain-containing protein [Gammaproteobacteria bacterium]